MLDVRVSNSVTPLTIGNITLPTNISPVNIDKLTLSNGRPISKGVFKELTPVQLIGDDGQFSGVYRCAGHVIWPTSWRSCDFVCTGVRRDYQDPRICRHLLLFDTTPEKNPYRAVLYRTPACNYMTVDQVNAASAAYLNTQILRRDALIALAGETHVETNSVPIEFLASEQINQIIASLTNSNRSRFDALRNGIRAERVARRNRQIAQVNNHNALWQQAISVPQRILSR